MPTIVDVDEINTLEYENTTMHVEEVKNPHKRLSSQKRMLKGRNLTCLGEKGCNKKNMPQV
jgi:hypothetical protein